MSIFFLYFLHIFGRNAFIFLIFYSMFHLTAAVKWILKIECASDLGLEWEDYVFNLEIHTCNSKVPTKHYTFAISYTPCCRMGSLMILMALMAYMKFQKQKTSWRLRRGFFQKRFVSFFKKIKKQKMRPEIGSPISLKKNKTQVSAVET